MSENTPQVFTSSEELQSYIGAPMELAVRKAIAYLDRHCRSFIARSPFVSIGTAASNGRADVSPRGDAPGFVQVLDDNTLFIPDRPGNNRMDTMLNIIENPNGIVRRTSRRVTRYRDANMALRWSASGFLEAEKSF